MTVMDRMMSTAPVLAANAVADNISASHARVLDPDEKEDMSPDVDDHDVTA